MSLCINPQCPQPKFNGNTDMYCQGCGSVLLLQGRYRATKLLGEGGFGQVYEVENPKTGESWVLKGLIEHKGLDVRQKWQQESAVLNKLGGRGIPKLAENGYFEFQP